MVPPAAININKTKPSSGPNLQALGLTPKKIFGLLSLVKVDGELVVKEASLNSDETAKIIVDFFQSKFGIKPKDLPYLALFIMADMKNGSLKIGGDNRIAISKEKILSYLKKIRHSQTPPEMRIERRKLSEKNPIENTGQAKATVKPKTLKFHPEVPEETKPSVEQCAGNLTTLLALFPQGKALISQAIQEQKLLGATV